MTGEHRESIAIQAEDQVRHLVQLAAVEVAYLGFAFDGSEAPLVKPRNLLVLVQAIGDDPMKLEGDAVFLSGTKVKSKGWVLAQKLQATCHHGVDDQDQPKMDFGMGQAKRHAPREEPGALDVLVSSGKASRWCRRRWMPHSRARLCVQNRRWFRMPRSSPPSGTRMTTRLAATLFASSINERTSAAAAGNTSPSSEMLRNLHNGSHSPSTAGSSRTRTRCPTTSKEGWSMSSR